MWLIILYLMVVFAGWVYVVFVLDFSGWWTIIFLLFMGVSYSEKKTKKDEPKEEHLNDWTAN